MCSTFEIVKRVAKDLEDELSENPFLVVNESELQAYLQQRLLETFPEEPNLTLKEGVDDRLRGGEKLCRRVYREARIRPGKSLAPDIIVLKDASQIIAPKENGAPARFLTPYSLIIETKMDASPKDVLAGKKGKPLSASTLRNDVEKWSAPSEAQDVISLVYTAQPEKYDSCDNTIIIKRTLPPGPAEAAPIEAISNALKAYEQAEEALYATFKQEPFRFLREKDFETYLFMKMRKAVKVKPNELHPVHTQWWSPWKKLLGGRRRHDLVVLAASQDNLALEIELKTSHSDKHKWFTKKPLIEEIRKMNKLVESKKLDRAIVLMYCFGPRDWEEDAKKVRKKSPNVTLSNRCSD